MTQVQELLTTFDHLSHDDQLEAAVEILRKTIQFNFPSLDDDELVACAEELFLALDYEEALYE